MATFVGFRRWLKSLRALNAHHAAIERHAEMLERHAEMLERHGGDIGWVKAASEALGATATTVQQALDVRTRQLQELTVALDALRSRVELESTQERETRDGVRMEINGLLSRLDDAARVADGLRRETRELAEHGERLRLRIAEAFPAFPAMRGLPGDAAALWFHATVEGSFRGSTDEIVERLRVYVPHVQSVAPDISALPAIDLGCGRGEWLGLMQHIGRSALGVDVNQVSVDRCIGAGFRAVCDDAIDHLRSASDHSASVISAFHVVEHLPLESMMTMLVEAHRVLAPGGLLLLETPNADNVRVGASTFHLDPTHRHPLPAPLLRIIVEFAGFEVVTTLDLQPDPELRALAERERWPGTLARLFAGPRDTGLIARTPSMAPDGERPGASGSA